MKNLKDKNVKLFVVSHKKINKKYYPDREVIYVGPNEDKIWEEGYYKDNLGDNIANKNSSFCECTAMYYIWKNVDCDIVGIEHYRRVFSYGFKMKTMQYFIKKLKKYDFIVMNEYPFLPTIRQQFCKYHDKKYLDLLEEAIRETEPSYLEAFNKVMDGHRLAWCNMLVTTKENYDKFCSFLFNVLFYVDAHISLLMIRIKKEWLAF